MIPSLSVKDKILMTLYRQGVKGLREKLIEKLPVASAEWAQLARDALKDPTSKERAGVFEQLMRPGFIEQHPERSALVGLVQRLMTDGCGAERREAARFVAANLRLFPVRSDSFQLEVMRLQSSTDALMADAADDLLDKMGIDLRDPALLGDEHDSLQL